MKEFLERIEKARFLTTDEIYKKRKEIRHEVQNFDTDTLEIYQWYFFRQLCLLKNPLKDLLWCYLVKERINDNYEEKLLKEYLKYKEKCRKIREYQARKDKEKGIEKNKNEKKKTIRINSVEDLFKI